MFRDTRYFSDVDGHEHGLGRVLLWWDYPTNPRLIIEEENGKPGKALYAKLVLNGEEAVREAQKLGAIMLKMRGAKGVRRVFEYRQVRQPDFQNDPRAGRYLPATFVDNPEPRAYEGEHIAPFGFWYHGYHLETFYTAFFSSIDMAEEILKDSSKNGVMVEMLGGYVEVSTLDHFRGHVRQAVGTTGDKNIFSKPLKYPKHIFR